ncbi:MAG: hypothetical protein H5T71_10770 [Chloroflexi bacterium]|nr:hypothetical protein [Chloroflexota bacterium]
MRIFAPPASQGSFVATWIGSGENPNHLRRPCADADIERLLAAEKKIDRHPGGTPDHLSKEASQWWASNDGVEYAMFGILEQKAFQSQRPRQLLGDEVHFNFANAERLADVGFRPQLARPRRAHL